MINIRQILPLSISLDRQKPKIFVGNKYGLVDLSKAILHSQLSLGNRTLLLGVEDPETYIYEMKLLMEKRKSGAADGLLYLADRKSLIQAYEKGFPNGPPPTDDPLKLVIIWSNGAFVFEL